eukprot:COSAG05_NODE_3948_length_1756_cov_7.670489_1_plen_128_part_10
MATRPFSCTREGALAYKPVTDSDLEVLIPAAVSVQKSRQQIDIGRLSSVGTIDKGIAVCEDAMAIHYSRLIVAECLRDNTIAINEASVVLAIQSLREKVQPLDNTKTPSKSLHGTVSGLDHLFHKWMA